MSSLLFLLPSLQLGRLELRCRQVFYHFRGRSHNDDEERVVDHALGVGQNIPLLSSFSSPLQIQFGKCSWSLPSYGNRQVPRAPNRKLRDAKAHRWCLQQTFSFVPRALGACPTAKQLRPKDLPKAKQLRPKDLPTTQGFRVHSYQGTSRGPALPKRKL